MRPGSAEMSLSAVRLLPTSIPREMQLECISSYEDFKEVGESKDSLIGTLTEIVYDYVI